MKKSDNWIIGENVKISGKARINVSEYLAIGDRSIIGDNVLIEGRQIEIGREAWIDEYSHIGGGSCFDYQSSLKAGDFLHMGKFSHVNTARKVTIGDECGIGINTKIFAHGAYLSAYDGFPVQFAEVKIGNRVWLPNAWVNPGTTIGDDVVVAAMSLVNRDLPSGCLAGGIPVKILKESVYPRELSQLEKEQLVKNIANDVRMDLTLENDQISITDANSKQVTVFNMKQRWIKGVGSKATEIVKNQLRRYGIRFKHFLENGEYRSW
jgi:acetyltransferase-like isoleucine patch superfamily enzyme